MNRSKSRTSVAIACGGTGGHLFPGLAVAQALSARDCAVTLLISPKEIDQKAIQNVSGLNIVTLPAVGLQAGNRLAFFRGFIQSLRVSRRLFRSTPPQAALAMGGFTSAPPILAAKWAGARTFLHESNTIAGRANRLLARFVNEAFTGFEQTVSGLKAPRVTRTGTPVRPEFQPRDPAACRRALGFDPAKPVMLVMGGSQGASGINELVISSLPLFAQAAPGLQWFHLTGPNDLEKVKQAYASAKLPARVETFWEEMHLALGAATLAVSRAGASSLAELAATLVPSILIPYPAAADNHQFFNAKAFADSGAACLLEQKTATPEELFRLTRPLLENTATRAKAQESLRAWHIPDAGDQIAGSMLRTVEVARSFLECCRIVFLSAP
jgi:UDP-N-acetylglucosamine--N-acetylmuramyl-(pentapeptide) pyrophosphoryl-undecaprenol N-acetylglucosamine transferase